MINSSVAVPAPVPLQFAIRLSAAVARSAAGQLRASYLHGSAALGGWTAERSDVDILFVAVDEIGAAAVHAIGDVLLAQAASCPGRGLEASLVTVSQAGRPAPPYPFKLHIGAGADGQRRYDGTEARGDADLLMHYAVCLAAGIAVFGPAAADCLGQVPRPEILAYLATELDWGLGHAPECYAVLNACRAAEYLTGGRIVAKIAGGEAALATGLGPPDLIKSALAQQRGQLPERPPGQAAVRFVRAVQARLVAAVGR